MAISPLAPASFPELPAIAGVRLSTTEAGIRYKQRTDLLLAEFAPGTTVAGVFTKSLTASGPVLSCRKNLKGGKARALIVNSGNANAFTGREGEKSVGRVIQAAAKALGCKAGEIFTASTGVIGEKLPDERITAALGNLKSRLAPGAWHQAARAIMTTDTYPKLATRRVSVGGTMVTLNGIAKGSGMIAPDMATMLAFVFTDAKIPARMLQGLLAEANDSTFNCITVDGDTSTSDTLLMFATGQARNKPLNASQRKGFATALHSLVKDLALQVVRDGEGAQKLITIKVTGAASDKAAKKIGLSIGNSPLVKTAIAASDANWGRIVMAVGKAGEKANRDKLSIAIGGVSVARKGTADPTYRESLIEGHMKGRDIQVEVDVGVGKGKATVYSCDLTHAYIDINGSYRT